MTVQIDGRRLRLFSTVTVFATPLDVTLDEIFIESYFPADAETAQYFIGPDGDADRSR